MGTGQSAPDQLIRRSLLNRGRWLGTSAVQAEDPRVCLLIVLGLCGSAHQLIGDIDRSATAQC
jgi:hypothetical protein